MTIDTAYVTAREKGDWLPLWQAYLTFYNNPLPEEVTDATFARFLDEREPMAMLVAKDGKEMLGFATFIKHRSTWAKTYYIYLEDLFVSDAARGKGVGRKLIDAVVTHARDHDCERVYWVTHADNAPARVLYDKVARLPGFVTYFVDM